MLLGYKSRNVTISHHGCTIKQTLTSGNGQTHNGCNAQFATCLGYTLQSLLSGREQQRLTHQIATRCTRDTQLRKYHHTHTTVGGTTHHCHNMLGIVLTIGHTHRRHRGCNLEISVFVHSYSLIYAFTISITYILWKSPSGYQRSTNSLSTKFSSRNIPEYILRHSSTRRACAIAGTS